MTTTNERLHPDAHGTVLVLDRTRRLVGVAEHVVERRMLIRDERSVVEGREAPDVLRSCHERLAVTHAIAGVVVPASCSARAGENAAQR
jgi:hypothetical protein